jgi:subtilisin family serine protease
VYSDTIWDAATCNPSTGVGDLGLSGSNFGTNVLIAAPSVCVETNGYAAGKPNYCTGTSCAAPFVSGTAALILQVNPPMTPLQLSQQLTDSAQPIYLLNSSNEIINQEIGPRLDPVAAVGAIRVTQNGDAKSTPLNLGFGSNVNSFTLGPYVALDGNTAPCEARANATTFKIALPCVYESSLSPTLGTGTYTLYVQLGTGATVDFFGTVNLTLPGLTFSSANGTNAIIQTPTQGTVSLYATGLKIASFNVQYSPP